MTLARNISQKGQSGSICLTEQAGPCVLMLDHHHQHHQDPFTRGMLQDRQDGTMERACELEV